MDTKKASFIGGAILGEEMLRQGQAEIYRDKGRAMAIIEQLRAEIRKAEKRGITQNQLALRSGVSGAAICRLMKKSRKRLWLDTVEKLAAGLELRLRLEK